MKFEQYKKEKEEIKLFHDEMHRKSKAYANPNVGCPRWASLCMEFAQEECDWHCFTQGQAFGEEPEEA